MSSSSAVCAARSERRHAPARSRDRRRVIRPTAAADRRSPRRRYGLAIGNPYIVASNLPGAVGAMVALSTIFPLLKGSGSLKSVQTALVGGTARAFAEKIAGKCPVPDDAVYVEDLLEGITHGAKVRALLKALFLPAAMLCPTRHFSPDDPATIIFSSGSTGDPKGT